ncbi:MAG: Response regulator receiver protein [Candidatus Wolfebacteria bacterium GW2011_GWC2_39_22]|uniref:Response regulator receiver protein n=1 Tax=Candidatus Wolfebacteria bacterium GW2011_GWC2_39_22 TaxID=1619013 RepID=A0A0G0N9N3_9BACT|nr:MAG: Response regulator receiver protein [Candidatus Wolfebacteria bacterium GW2011_GWC2_39_22]HBI25236.1 response regulator [Candidatus Wolfebacteria bacterium]
MSKKNKMILLVDDDIFLRNFMVGMLDQFGYTAITAKDGAEGLIIAEENQFDLVITDHDMPVMKGAEMVAKLRDKGVQTPIIMVSSTPGSEDTPGISGFLSKPFLSKELVDMIERLTVSAVAA